MNASELHNAAMEAADRAFHFVRSGEAERALSHFQQAWPLERDAAMAARREQVGEPSESVLFRSAASLALNAKAFAEAEKLVAFGLSGDPPPAIADELRDLYETVNFERHLALQGVELSGSELQMSIAGAGVGFGFAKKNLVTMRLDNLERLTVRTIERIAKRPFRESGPAKKEFKGAFESYLSVPRAASFAFTVHFGVPTSQLELSGTETPVVAVDDVLDKISLINEGREDDVEQQIHDAAYYQNFFALTKELAPDGHDVSLVGFTVVRNGRERRVQLTRTKSEFGLSATAAKSKSFNPEDRVQFRGRLIAADSDDKQFALKPEGGAKVTVEVPEGLSDIVRNYWDDEVEVVCVQTGPNKFRLLDLSSASV